jgi:uncharacterized membrane protein YgcG
MAANRGKVVLGAVIVVAAAASLFVITRPRTRLPTRMPATSSAIGSAQALPVDSLKRASPDLASLVPAAPLNGSLVDETGLLSTSARDSLTREIARIQHETHGDIAVAILPSIGGYTALSVAGTIFRTWRVGTPVKIGADSVSLGVVMLIVPRERAPDGVGRCTLTTGSGMKTVLSDSVASSICTDDVVPHLRLGDFSGAVHAGVEAIAMHFRAGVGASAGGATKRTGTAPTFR